MRPDAELALQLDSARLEQAAPAFKASEQLLGVLQRRRLNQDSQQLGIGKRLRPGLVQSVDRALAGGKLTDAGHSGELGRVVLHTGLTDWHAQRARITICDQPRATTAQPWYGCGSMAQHEARSCDERTAMTRISTRAQVEHINQFLADLVAREVRLSALLAEAGLPDAALATLRSAHLDAFVAQLLEQWRALIIALLPERHAHFVVRRYGLDGQSIPTLAELGERFDVSRERIRQLEVGGMRRLRTAQRRRALLQCILDAVGATGVLPSGTGLALPEWARPAASTGDEATDEPQAPRPARITPAFMLEARQKHPRAYEPWTAADDAFLREQFAQGTPVNELAEHLGRRWSAVTNRLVKLGLLQAEEPDEAASAAESDTMEDA